MNTIRQILALIIFIFCITFFNACKKNDSTPTTPGDNIDTAKIVISEKGTPFGDISEMSIGPGGGTIASSDGEAVLVIPPGALTNTINISIQAITHTLPQRLSEKAYQFLPEGLTFSVPAQLTLKYDTAANQGTSSAGLVIVDQLPDGSWMHDAEVVANESSFTLTGNMEHFSTWGVAKALRISQTNTFVEPGGKVNFFLQAMETYTPKPIPGKRRKKATVKMLDIGDWVKKLENKNDFFISGWRLNYNNAPGLAKDGKLTETSTKIIATYTAPTGLAPDLNPVLIQGVVSNSIGLPNLIANAVVFVRKNGFLKVTLGGKATYYTQYIAEPSISPFVNASVVPGVSKMIILAQDFSNGNSLSIVLANAKKGFNYMACDNPEQVAIASEKNIGWKQEYYTRSNGNGTRRCSEFGPKCSTIIVNLDEFSGDPGGWFSGFASGTLYNDTDINRAACQNSDFKNIMVQFVLKSGW